MPDISTNTTTTSTDRRITSRIDRRIPATTCRCRSSPRRTKPIRSRRCSNDSSGRSTTQPMSSFRSAIAEFMDMTELIRHVATEVFVADNDGFLGNWGMNNFYLYRLRDRSPVPVRRLGQERSVQGHARLLDLAQPSRYGRCDAQPVCGHGVMAFPDLKTLYLDTLLECANAVVEVPATSTPDDTRGWLRARSRPAIRADHAAVLADPQKPYSNDQFQAAVNFVRDFVRQRPDFVRDQVAASR